MMSTLKNEIEVEYGDRLGNSEEDAPIRLSVFWSYNFYILGFPSFRFLHYMYFVI